MSVARAYANLFTMGHCAPAVMRTLGDVSAPGKDWLVTLSAGMPGGIGNTGHECGAVTSSVMKASRRRSSPMGVLLAVAVLFVLFTALESVQPDEPAYALLSLVIAGLGIVALRVCGVSRQEMRLRFAPLSLVGGVLLAAATLLMLPILASSSGFVGWRWLPALVYAPSSGVAQEFFFRGTVLPALERAVPGRTGMALLMHSALFVVWHLRTFTLLPSPSVALVVATVLFLAGTAWGRQVQDDGTIVWSAAQHSLFLIAISMFDWA